MNSINQPLKNIGIYRFVNNSFFKMTMDDSKMQNLIENSIEQIKQRLVDKLSFVFLWKEDLGKNEPMTIYVSLEDEPEDGLKRGFASSQTSSRSHKMIFFKRNQINGFFFNPKGYDQYYRIVSVDGNSDNLTENFFYIESTHEIIHHLSTLNGIHIKEEDVILLSIYLLKNKKVQIKLKQPTM